MPLVIAILVYIFTYNILNTIVDNHINTDPPKYIYYEHGVPHYISGPKEISCTWNCPPKNTVIIYSYNGHPVSQIK